MRGASPGRARRSRLAGLAYPPSVVFVIVETGNHFPVDAAADAAIAGVALVAAPLLVTPPSIVGGAVLQLPQIKQETAMALGDEIDNIFRREVKSLPAYEKAQAASGSGIAPPVDEMNQLLMGLVVATQRSFHLLADRIEDRENA